MRVTSGLFRNELVEWRMMHVAILLHFIELVGKFDEVFYEVFSFIGEFDEVFSYMKFFLLLGNLMKFFLLL